MHERDRRRAATLPRNKPVTPRPPQPDFRDGKGYKKITSRKVGWIVGSIIFLATAFACVDYWGPKKTVRETILGFPNAGNVFLIRTDKSYFAIDTRLEYETVNMHNVPVDVDHSMLTGTVLSFSNPSDTAGTKYYPLSTIYSYIWLIALTAVAGLLLMFFPKTNDFRMYLVVFSLILFLSSAITVISMKVTIDEIYATKTIGW